MTRRKFFKRLSAWAGSGLVAGYPFFIERRLLQINHYRVPLARLPRSFEGFKIVHLTDLHYGPLVSQRYIQQVIDAANQIPRDMIVSTGDFVQDKPEQMDFVFPQLGRLRAKHGVYATLGNHDNWVDFKKADAWLSRIGQNLRHRAVALKQNSETLWIGGAGDFNEDVLGIDAAFADAPESDCKIVLAHTPDSADAQFKTRVDLMISGHTHGGQVVVPFYGPPILPVKNKRYVGGIVKTQRMTIFISRGIGWAILPVRFNCPPEIAVLTLTRRL